MPRLLPKSHTSVAFIVLLIAALFSGSDGPIKHVTSILGSAAKVTEAASLVVDSGADLTTTTLRSMVSITTGTLNLAETAWHGVALTGMDAKQVCGRVSADRASVSAMAAKRSWSQCHRRARSGQRAVGTTSLAGGCPDALSALCRGTSQRFHLLHQA